LVLQLHRGSIKIASVAQPGILSEIAERIASLSLGRQASSIAIVLPIKAEAYSEVAKLVRRGPPFDPEASGIEEHRVFLTEREAVFVFESAAAGTLERLISDANVLAAAGAWRDLVDGPPRLAELAYSWTRPVDNSISFEPTPGPGDSDGGDLFTP
jgi:hypothetical protein